MGFIGFTWGLYRGFKSSWAGAYGYTHRGSGSIGPGCGLFWVPSGPIWLLCSLTWPMWVERISWSGCSLGLGNLGESTLLGSLLGLGFIAWMAGCLHNNRPQLRN